MMVAKTEKEREFVSELASLLEKFNVEVTVEEDRTLSDRTGSFELCFESGRGESSILVFTSKFLDSKELRQMLEGGL